MPRVLPWLADGGRRERSPAHPTRLDNQRTPSPGPTQQPTADLTTPRHLDVLRSSRSPPTSPTTEAPPTEEYIKEGLDNDDMYIMVEDEFYAIAQQFTRHLHQAEYVRRRKQAKTVNARVFHDMERPTDEKVSMSRATLKRKESELLRERQRRGLAPTARRPRTEDEDEDDEEIMNGLEEEEEREDDPWYGTSLHTLMVSPPKNRSLAGLQSIRSSTRAAAGFRSAELARSPSNNNMRQASTNGQQPANESAAPSSSSDEDDDLEIIESRSSRPNLLPPSDVRVRTSLVKRESPEFDIMPTLRHSNTPGAQSSDTRRRVTISGDKRTDNDENLEQRPGSINGHVRSRISDQEQKPKATRHSDSYTISARPRKRMFFDDLDDVVTVDIKAEDAESKDGIIQGQPRKSLSTTTKGSRSTHPTPDQQQQKTVKKSRLNDIPTFLV